MAIADVIFKRMCRDIIDNGISSEGQLVRPKWEDGTPAHTIKKFGVVNRYDLRKEFPALTLRPTPYRGALDEILWIYQKKSNNINDLGSHIWDQWADEKGSIGKAYGYQVGNRYIHHTTDAEGVKEIDNIHTEYPSAAWSIAHGGKYCVYLDQIDGVIWDLKHNPFSRRIITNLYNFDDLVDMALYPCAYSMTFNVTTESGYDKPILNLLLNQRSQDTLAANNWNVVQYAMLLAIIAQCVDMIPGELLHVIADCHIYDRHIPIIEELLTRKEHNAPKLWINTDKKDFYDFTVDDIHLLNYEYEPQIKGIPIAV